MDHALQALLRMVKSALTEQAVELTVPLDLQEVGALAVRHQVEGLAYDGAMRCGVSKQEPGMRSLFQAYCRAALKSELQVKALEALYGAFDREGVDYLPLKGCIMKWMYPVPELRAMNDADILIRVEQYEKIGPLMEALDYRFVAESDCELKWTTPGLYVELHKRLIPSFIKDFYAYFGDGWQLAHPEEGTRYAMGAEDEFLFIFTHFARHYREGGVGIRHMADIWQYRRSRPELDEEKLRAVLKKLSLETFYDNILLTLLNWFEDGEETEITDMITRYIANSGSFGNEETKGVADSMRRAKGKGKRGLVVKTLFPPLENMRYAYPVLQKAPVLLPAMWAYRGIKVTLFRRDLLKEQGGRFKEADKIDAFERSLRAVGLGMEFEEN
ncbi:MAG: nucleotidyltransferase family protein [Oscillospiraceae bacterium]|nr:nucleotidyltransferase family protein [Oscillospiraceae bacterium]